MTKHFGPGYFRFLLALIVVIYHVTSFLFIGQACVYTFFILSGYWVSKMYIEKYSKYPDPLLSFYSSRIIRLAPTFYFISLCSAIIYIIYNYPIIIQLLNNNWIQKTSFLLSNLILLGYASQPVKLIVPAWSIDIEMQFYIFLPLILIIRKWIPIFVLLTLSLFIALSIYVYDMPILKNTLFQYVFYFLIGFCLYEYEEWQLERYKLVSITLFFIATIFSVVVIQVLKFHVDELVNFLLPLPLIPFIAWNVQQKSDLLDRESGNISYVVYLLHFPLIQVYVYYLGDVTGFFKLIYAVAYLIGTIVLSIVVYYAVDRPINSLRIKAFGISSKENILLKSN